MDSIVCNIIDWDYYHEGDYENDEEIEDEDKEFVIDIFGRTENNKSIYIKVTKFTPFFFIEIPESWKSSQINLLKKSLPHKLYGISKKQKY